MNPHRQQDRLGFSSSHSSRRQFIAASAGAIIAGGTIGAPGGDAATASGPTLGFNTYGMKTLSTEQALAELAKIGFDSVQLDCSAGCDADPARLTPARRADVRKIARDVGLKLTAVQGIPRPSFDAKKRGSDLDRLKTLGELVHELDPEHPLLVEVGLGGKDPFEKMNPIFVKDVAEMVKIADAGDFLLCVKPHRDTSMDRPDQAIELFKELGFPKRLRMSFDYSHFALRDMPLVDAIHTVLPYTGFVAIKDVAIENGKTAFKLPGETGKIDYVTLIREFHAGGYRGDYNCEISSMIFRKPGFDCLAAARLSYVNIAPAFVAAGVERVKRRHA